MPSEEAAYYALNQDDSLPDCNMKGNEDEG